jgi:hypothetical protein
VEAGQSFGEDGVIADAPQLGGEIDRQRLADVADGEGDRAVLSANGQHNRIEERDRKLLDWHTEVGSFICRHSITFVLSL